MAQIDVLAQKVALLTQAVNDIYANAKTTGEFPYQSPLVQGSKVRVEDGTDSKFILLRDIINQASTVLTNKLLYFNGVTIVGNTVTLLAGSVWRVNNVIYSNIENIPFSVPYVSTSGDFRTDLIVAGASNSDVTKIAGADSDVPIEPNYPNDKVIICSLKITDSSISIDDSSVVAWGNIIGNISDQIDLQNALANKMNLYVEMADLLGNYTFQLGDEKKFFIYDGATNVNVFFEKTSITSFPIGSIITIYVKNTGAVTPLFSFPATNVNNTAYLSKIIQGETRKFTKIATDAWVSDSDLGVTVGTDAETQITAVVPEDNKVVSRLKLFKWWVWQKTLAQVFESSVKALSFNTGDYVNLNLYSANFVKSATSRISIDAANSRIIGQNGENTTVVYFSPTTAPKAIYFPNENGTVLLQETLTSVQISQFQKNGTLPMYIRVNNFTSDVLEDLRIILGSGTNIPYFQRCVLANATKGGGFWERAVSTLKLNNTNTAVANLAVNTGVLIQLSDPLFFTWAVDTQSSKTGGQVSELINGDYVKDVDDKTANNFRITIEVSYTAGAGDGTLELSIINLSLLVIDQDTVTINIDGKGASKKRVVFNVRAVKTTDNASGYRIRLSNGSKEITEYRLVNILRTNN